MVIVAIILAAILAGAGAYVLLLPKDDLEATISPASVDLEAGDSETLSVSVTIGGDEPAEDADITYLWSRSPITLGTFNRTAKAEVTFTSSIVGGEGTISCVVEYGDQEVTETIDVTVNEPFLDSVSVVPSTIRIDPGETKTFTAVPVASAGSTLTGVTYAWAVGGVLSDDYTISATTGASVDFTCDVVDVAWLNVTATHTTTAHGTITKVGTAAVTIELDTSERSVDYYFYDMFNVPFGEWWDLRCAFYGDEEITHDTYPYLFRWFGAAEGNTWEYTNQRATITGRNMTDMNMNERPVFLPFLGDTRGGTAEIDWYMQYLTSEEMSTFPEATENWYDGWVIQLTGTVTLDLEAAMAVIGLTSAGFDDFDNWWAANGFGVEEDFSDWMYYEGNERLDIYNMYEYPFAPMRWVLDAERVGDKIVLDYDHISWGMEALMTRWMRDAFTRDHEWYLEDMEFKATIGPEMTTLDVDTVIVYAQYAYQTADDLVPCWMWEALVQDYLPSTIAHNVSEYDLYADLTYEMLSPGSPLYNEWMTYDYAPGVINLTEGETLRFTWPGGDDVMFYVPGPELIPTYGAMTIASSEPYITDFPDQISLDTVNREMVFTGPLNMYNWSRDQTAHVGLESEWDRLLGVLPYGCPTIEFRLEAESEPTSFTVEGVPSPVETGVSSEFTVTVLDQFNDPIAGYLGTVTFESTDLAADLPDDYTFLVADAGVKTFDVTFNTAGTQDLTVIDDADSDLRGQQSDIEVVESARADHFAIAMVDPEEVVKATLLTSFVVTVKDQFDNDFPGYVGEVEFSSTDELAVVIPDPYTFLVGDEGVATFEVTFMTPGPQSLTATDTADVSITGTLEDIEVLAAPEATSFVLSDIPDPAQINRWHDVTVSAYDQYGDPFPDYLGTVTFDSIPDTDIVLPADHEFVVGDAGEYTFDGELNFTAVGSYEINCSDIGAPEIYGVVTIEAVADLPIPTYIVVEGITDMLTYETSDVVVTVYDQYDTVYEPYDGEVEFTTDATAGTFTLPGLTTFDLADEGTITLSDAVSFTVGGTYTVTVEDTSDPSITGDQDTIVIEDRIPTTMEMTGTPSSVFAEDTFSATVTVLDQYGDPCLGYDGTVSFSTTDSDGGVDLPDDYEFVLGDSGVREFTDEFVLMTSGDWDVMVTDGSLSDSVTVTVLAPQDREVAYMIYDMFEEPFGEWWDYRTPYYGSDYILSDEDGMHTYLYFVRGDDGDDTQAEIYAPYRYATDGTYVPTLNVHAPEFMPRMEASQEGAEVYLEVYMQYASEDWWNGWWEDTFDVGGWQNIVPGGNDGYAVCAVYNATMNRAAAFEYLGLPETEANPVSWWNANGDDYVDEFEAWLDVQGNVEHDISYGYEWSYSTESSFSTITYDEVEDEIKLTYGLASWGYEVLMTRWLTDIGISPHHEPYYEDFTLVVEYGELNSNLTTDGVAQYSLHAVKANQTGGAAWVWEPALIDYCPFAVDITPVNLVHDRPSDYAAYETRFYQSWNSGDINYGVANLAAYEYTPTWFNLTEGETFTLQMPTTSVKGYEGAALTYDDYADAAGGDYTAFDAITVEDTMSLGYYVTQGVDLDARYVDGTKTLTMVGPLDFDNVRWADGYLYHGAPWIEMTVGGSKYAAVSEIPVVEGEMSSAAAGPTTVSELVSLISVMAAVSLLAAAVVIGNRRHR
ncbi:MAG: hypothetical protein MUO94_03500 [Thermoplasmata archaeon]|nr:hypothetical protein [Thermoplasmata archaeon]